MLVPSNTRFAPTIPDNILVNEGLGSHINFTKGKTYRMRVINFAAFGSAMIHFKSHTMKVMMNDGAYLQQQDAAMLRVAPGQRYDFLVEAADKDSGNYPFLISLDINRDWTNASEPQVWPYNYTGYLVMDPSQTLNKVDVVKNWQSVDESSFKPYDGASAYSSYDRLILLDFKFCLDKNGYPR